MLCPFICGNISTLPADVKILNMMFYSCDATPLQNNVPWGYGLHVRELFPDFLSGEKIAQGSDQADTPDMQVWYNDYAGEGEMLWFVRPYERR